MSEYNKLIVLDDDAASWVKKFIDKGGLSYLQSQLNMDEVVAVILENEGEQFNMYREKNVVQEFVSPTVDGIPKEVVLGILEEIKSNGQNIILMCDWEWQVNLEGEQMKESMETILKSFEDAKVLEDGTETYNKLAIIFYTAHLEEDIVLPKGQDNIVIIQKSILGWSWKDITSSVYRLKKVINFLEEMEAK